MSKQIAIKASKEKISGDGNEMKLSRKPAKKWQGLMAVVLIICGVSFTLAQSNQKKMNTQKYTMLCLGDSYTIGEAVGEEERFAQQAIAMLGKEGIAFAQPLIIAKTGWTTDELIHAIAESKTSGVYDYVTLLIGVNNEYRQYDHEVYRKEYNELLTTAIRYAGGREDHVFVLSIPDWGVTPYAAGDPKLRTESQIGAEVDQYNAICKQETTRTKAHYIDINPISKKAKTDAALIANDRLHPSGKMYAEWAALLAPALKAQIGK